MSEPLPQLGAVPHLPRAACRGAPEPLWDDKVGGRNGKQRELAADRERRHEMARAICRRCPEVLACIRVRRDDPTLPPGIWGGCWVGSGPERTVNPSLIRVRKERGAA